MNRQKLYKKTRFVLLAIVVISLLLVSTFGAIQSTDTLSNEAYAAVPQGTASILNLNNNGGYIDNFTGALKGAQNEYIYFGVMPGTTTPVVWRVLDTHDKKYCADPNGGILLWSDEQIDTYKYNDGANDTQLAFWNNSKIRAKLNGGSYINGSIVSGQSYFELMFTDSKEQGGVIPVGKDYETRCWGYNTYPNTGSNYYYYYTTDLTHATSNSGYYTQDMVDNAVDAKIEGTSVVETSTDDKLFLLDNHDINNKAFGFVDANGKTYADNVMKVTWNDTGAHRGYPGYYDYNSQGKVGLMPDSVKASSHYWLRPAGRFNAVSMAMIVHNSNFMGDAGVSAELGIRPGFIFNPKSLIYATSSNAGNSAKLISVTTPNNLKNGKSAYKVYMQSFNYTNYNLPENNASAPEVAVGNGKIMVTKSGLTANKVVVLLADKNGSGEVKYQATATFNGEATITIPNGLNAYDYNISVMFINDYKGGNFVEEVAGSYTGGGVAIPQDISIDYSGNIIGREILEKQDWYDASIYNDTSKMTINMPPSNIQDAGTYDITFTLNDADLTWADGKKGTKTITLTINKISPGSVSASIDYTNETITVSGDKTLAGLTYEYDVGGSGSWTDFTSGDIALNNWFGKNIRLRIKPNKNYNDSNIVSLTIPNRPNAPTFEIDVFKEGVLVPSGYYYNTTNAYGGLAGSGGYIDVDAEATIYIYQGATADTFKSEIQTLTAPARGVIGTDWGIDWIKETTNIEVGADCEYKFQGEKDYTKGTGTKIALNPGAMPKILTYHKSAIPGECYQGEEKKLTIPARDPAPVGITVQSDGKVIGLNDKMEYAYKDDPDFYPVDNPDNVYLPTGTYYFRNKAIIGEKFASFNYELYIKETIAKVNIRLEWDKKEFTYNGQIQYPKPIFERADNGQPVKVNYEIKGGEPTSTTVNHYRIEIEITDTNYNLTEGETYCGYDIIKREFLPPSLKGNIEYNGKLQSLEGFLNGFETDYMTIASGGEYQNAGTYSAVIRLTDTANCKWSGENTGTSIEISWKIEPKYIIVGWDTFTFVANGEVQAPKAIVTDWCEGENPTLLYEGDYQTSIDAGKYHIGVFIDPTDTIACMNYVLEQATNKDYYIIPKAGMTVVKIVWDNTEFVYNGEVQAPKATIFDLDDNDITSQITIEYTNDYATSKWAGEYKVGIKLPSNYYISSDAIVQYKIKEGENGEGGINDPNHPDNPNNGGGGNGNGSNGGSIINLPDNFPLWQMSVSGISILLSVFFIAKTIGYANKRKKEKRTAEKLNKSYAFAPMIGTAEVLWGLSATAWTSMAFSLLGFSVVMFIVMMIVRHKWVVAVEETENARIAERERHEAEERERRDSDMKMLIMMMNNRGGGNDGQATYAQEYQPYNDNVEEIVTRVVTALLPSMQALPAVSDETTNKQLDKLTEIIVQQTQKLEKLDELEQTIVQQNLSMEMQSNIIEQQTQKLEKLDELEQTIVQQNLSMEMQSSIIEQQSKVIEDLQYKVYNEDYDDEDEWVDDEEEDFYEPDDDDDDDAELFVTDDVPVGKRVHVPSNFRIRMKLGSDKNRNAYAVIKNKLSSFKKVSFRMSGRIEKVMYKGEPLMYIGVVRKSLKLWLALDPNEFDSKRYFQRDASDKVRYQKVPMLVRVGSDRALKRADELIEILAAQYGLELRRKYNEKSLQELAYTLKGNALVKDKMPELLREVIHVHDADILTNEDAERYIETREKLYQAEENFATISIDVLEENFYDGQKVTLEKLQKKGLVAEECNGYRLTAGERLTKPLYVVADEFAPTAVKMIVLTGGRAIQLAEIEEKI